jgi:hypothetical protein
MCGGGGSPPPKDTYAGNGTKLGGSLDPAYGHNPDPNGGPVAFSADDTDYAKSNQRPRDDTKSGALKM